MSCLVASFHTTWPVAWSVVFGHACASAISRSCCLKHGSQLPDIHIYGIPSLVLHTILRISSVSIQNKEVHIFHRRSASAAKVVPVVAAVRFVYYGAPLLIECQSKLQDEMTPRGGFIRPVNLGLAG